MRDFICSTKKGVATISLTTPVKQEVLRANQACVLRLLSLDPMGRFAWKQWRSQAKAQDKARLALSLQLLSQLHHSLSLNMVVGLHPLLAPACYETAWDSTDTKAGWGSGDGAITPLWVLPKTATMLQGRDVFQYIDQRDVHHWALLIQAGDRGAMLRPFSASGAAVSAPFRKVIRSFTKRMHGRGLPLRQKGQIASAPIDAERR